MPTRKKRGKPRRSGNSWERYPDMAHLSGDAQVQMQIRRRHRAIRYGLFRLQTAVEKDADVAKVCADLPPGFAGYWLEQVPAYQMVPGPGGILIKAEVPDFRARTIEQWGGYGEFARLWDVDAELKVYLRHSSIWQEWNATLMRVVPILGEH